MYRKVLMAYDGSEGAKAALDRAVTLTRLNHADMTMVWVRSPLPHHALSLAEDEAEADAADEYFEDLKAQVLARAGGLPCRVECVALYGDAAHEIVHFADLKGFDLIILGQTGHADIISRMLGQTADRICETAKCDVLIVHRPAAR